MNYDDVPKIKVGDKLIIRLGTYYEYQIVILEIKENYNGMFDEDNPIKYDRYFFANYIAKRETSNSVWLKYPDTDCQFGLYIDGSPSDVDEEFMFNRLDWLEKPKPEKYIINDNRLKFKLSFLGD